MSPGSFDESETTCALSAEFSGWLSVSDCTVTETSVIVTLEPIFDAALFTIEFTHFTNPPSASVSEFSIKRYKSGSLYEEAEASLSGLTAIQLQDATLETQSDQIGE